jgi:hypothetical protein
MHNQSFGRHLPLTPWHLVQRRFFDGREPGILGFAARHHLNVADVLDLFSGRVISFSLEMCAALSNETKMSKDFFRNLSNRWSPQLPPAASAALSPGPFFFL